MSEKTPAQVRIEELEKKREARRAARSAKRDEQHALDLEALDALEDQYGAERLAVLRLDGADGERYVDGIPTLVVVKAPDEARVARYRAELKPKRKGRDGALEQVDPIPPLVLLGRSCLVYPPTQEQLDAILAELPGVDVQIGKLAASLAAGREEAEGKG